MLQTKPVPFTVWRWTQQIPLLYLCLQNYTAPSLKKLHLNFASQRNTKRRKGAASSATPLLSGQSNQSLAGDFCFTHLVPPHTCISFLGTVDYYNAARRVDENFPKSIVLN